MSDKIAVASLSTMAKIMEIEGERAIAEDNLPATVCLGIFSCIFRWAEKRARKTQSF